MEVGLGSPALLVSKGHQYLIIKQSVEGLRGVLAPNLWRLFEYLSDYYKQRNKCRANI